jgi:hypothetical protein
MIRMIQRIDTEEPPFERSFVGEETGETGNRLRDRLNRRLTPRQAHGIRQAQGGIPEPLSSMTGLTPIHVRSGGLGIPRGYPSHRVDTLPRAEGQRSSG